MSRIVILSGSHVCQNPRALKEASTLAAAGHDVTFIGVTRRADFDAQDRALMTGQSFRRLTVDYASGWPARIAGIVQRAQTRLARGLVARFGRESIHALGPARALLAAARRLQFDLLIAHTEVPLCLAERLAAEGRNVAVDMEDWYSEDLLPAARRSRPLALLRRAERAALHRASYVSVPSRSMAAALVAAYGGRPPVVVRNCFPLQAAPRPARPPRSRDVPRCVWFSQTVGPGRGLEEFLAAWAGMRVRTEIHFIGAVRPAFQDVLLGPLSPAQRADVHFHGPLDPAELPGRLADFDAGLAVELSHPPSRDTTVTNKILQYLNAGLAVVATPTTGQREVLAAAPGAGLCVDLVPPGPAAADLDGFFGAPDRLAASQRAARAAAEREFCWEKESACLIAAVESALAAAPGRP